MRACILLVVIAQWSECTNASTLRTSALASHSIVRTLNQLYYTLKKSINFGLHLLEYSIITGYRYVMRPLRSLDCLG